MTGLIIALALASIPVVSQRTAPPRVASGEAQAYVAPTEAPAPLPTRNIFFSVGVDTLTKLQKSRLAAVASLGRRIHVKGYTDTTGDERLNRAIALRRARAVAGRIPGATYEGMGETIKFGAGGADNRRVTLHTRRAR